MSYEFIPGLDAVPGTYFSSLPKELIVLLSYYYFFPIRIKILAGSVFERKFLITIIGNFGETIPKYIKSDLHLNDVLETITNKDKLTYDNGDITINSLNDVLTFSMAIGFTHMTVKLDTKETEALKIKLQYILAEIEGYIKQGLSETIIYNRVTKYYY